MFSCRTAPNEAPFPLLPEPAVIRLNKLFNRLKPRSAVWRTTLVISIVVLVTEFVSIAFFWTNLYSPEMRQHARYTAAQIHMLREVERAAPNEERAQAVYEWVNATAGFELVRDPRKFPDVVDKPFVELFSGLYERSLRRELGEPVTVYFKFKPVPSAYIHVASMPNVWIREPLIFFARYDPYIIIAFIVGVPLLAVTAIVILVRQLNRPLKRLQLAALRVGKGQHATLLDTQSGPMEIRAVNRAFNQMTREIQQAAKERAFMLAAISHDLRTPLTRLRLTAELLREREPEVAEGMVLDIEDMDAILDQFIAYMRDGSDEAVETANLNLLISEIVAQVAAQTDLDFQPGELPDMPMKRLSLKRMLDNLVANALRYGRPPVHIRTAHQAVEKTVTVTVRDHGPGIDEAQLPQLLQPFVRGEAARTTQGSGLGLAIVARIVKMHNGRLDIRNHPEGGLEVTVTLPLNRRPGRA